MFTEVLLKDEARERLLEGINLTYEAVAATLGPSGRFTIYSYDDMSVVSKDGVNTIRAIKFKDPVKNAGKQLVESAASKTVADCGDGTTTTTILLKEFISEGLKAIAANMNPVLVKKGIELGVKEVTANIEAMALKIDDKDERLTDIATVSANNDESIGTMVADAMFSVGSKGLITLDRSKTDETTVDLIDGYRFEKGYADPYFINVDGTGKVMYDDALILMSENTVTDMAEIAPVIEVYNKMCGDEQRNIPLIFIVSEMTGQALATLITNRKEKSIPFAVIEAYGFGTLRKEILEDIATYTGGTVMSKSLGKSFSDITEKDFGRVERVVANHKETLLTNGAGDPDKIQKRLDDMESIKELSDTNHEEGVIEDRIAKLRGKVAIINIGATTDEELIEKKDRLDDAIGAVTAAVKGGIVPGGGISLLRSKLAPLSEDYHRDVRYGYELINRVLEAPIRRMLDNAGVNTDVIINEVENSSEQNFGYNLFTEEFGDMLEYGVIDPALVPITAIKSASTVASMVLTVGSLIHKNIDNE
jgi:chaperonin GroEL